eukprot:1184714-Prorocentrum_minimum.AAC.2
MISAYAVTFQSRNEVDYPDGADGTFKRAHEVIRNDVEKEILKVKTKKSTPSVFVTKERDAYFLPLRRRSRGSLRCTFRRPTRTFLFDAYTSPCFILVFFNRLQPGGDCAPGGRGLRGGPRHRRQRRRPPPRGHRRTARRAARGVLRPRSLVAGHVRRVLPALPAALRLRPRAQVRAAVLPMPNYSCITR